MSFIEKNYEKRIVAFIDILGYKKLIQNEEEFKRLTGLLLAIKSENQTINKKCADIRQPNKSFVIIPDIDSYSDHIIISAPLESYNIINSNDPDILKFNILFEAIACWTSKLQLFLLREGISSRGAISCGKLYYDPENKIFTGNCLNEAVENESKVSIYPRVVLSQSILEYSEQLGLSGHAFHTRTDFDGIHYIDYLSVMARNKEKNEAFLFFQCAREKISHNLKNKELKIASKWKWLASYFDTIIEIWNNNNTNKRIEKFCLQKYNLEQLIKTHKERTSQTN